MSVYETFEILTEKFDHVICIDTETGERFECPGELPVDLAGLDEYEVVFVEG